MISEIEFYNNCNNKRCLRNTFLSKNCLKEYRRKLCYSKYVQQQDKAEQKRIGKYLEKGKEIKEYLDKKERGEEIEYEVDEVQLAFRTKIIERDKECQVWKILTPNERIDIVKYFFNDFITNCNILDVAHIISRSQAPQLLYDENNVFLCSRYFHSLLDQYKDLVTRMPIKNKERINWINRIMQENEKWKKDYTYEDFYKEKI